MSVLLEFSIFPTTEGESLGRYVSRVIAMIRDSGVSYKLTAMGTIIETDTVAEALALVEKAHATLEAEGCNRIYASMKMDVRKGGGNRLESKIDSVRSQIGDIEL